MSAELEGVLLVDKPTDITSAGAVRLLKGRLRPKKIGHGGTLDPFATGLLVILLGRGTKLSPLFLDGDKSYSGVIRLGLGTDTDDITGTAISTDEHVGEKLTPETWAELESRMVKQFSGELEQVPPRYSALKIGGERSYDLARKGLEFETKPRTVRIERLELRFLSPERLEYRMRCSKGTYVRSLGRDIGAALGTCGCVETLRREETSGFKIEEACPLEELNPENAARFVIPPPAVLERMSAKIGGGLGAPAGFVQIPKIV